MDGWLDAWKRNDALKRPHRDCHNESLIAEMGDISSSFHLDEDRLLEVDEANDTCNTCKLLINSLVVFSLRQQDKSALEWVPKQRKSFYFKLAFLI